VGGVGQQGRGRSELALLELGGHPLQLRPGVLGAFLGEDRAHQAGDHRLGVAGYGGQQVAHDMKP
jgi:hypothetical protein